MRIQALARLAALGLLVTTPVLAQVTPSNPNAAN